MDNFWFMYSIWLVSNVTNIAAIFCFLTVLIGVILGMNYCMDMDSSYDFGIREEIKETFRKRILICLGAFVSFVIVANVVPDKQGLMFIFGGSAALSIAEDKQVSETARKALDWIGRQLEEK